jgi:hypothetical protein
MKAARSEEERVEVKRRKKSYKAEIEGEEGITVLVGG